MEENLTFSNKSHLDRTKYILSCITTTEISSSGGYHSDCNDIIDTRDDTSSSDGSHSTIIHYSHSIYNQYKPQQYKPDNIISKDDIHAKTLENDYVQPMNLFIYLITL